MVFYLKIKFQLCICMYVYMCAQHLWMSVDKLWKFVCFSRLVLSYLKAWWAISIYFLEDEYILLPNYSTVVNFSKKKLIFYFPTLSADTFCCCCLGLFGFWEGFLLCSSGYPSSHYVKLALPSQRSACLWLTSAGIKGLLPHPALALKKKKVWPFLACNTFRTSLCLIKIWRIQSPPTPTPQAF